MEYTKNYHLPQWVKSDRIMMDDFNKMNANIENGLNQTAQTADEAKSIAQTAADQLPYVVGSYRGTSQEQDVYLGFKPAVVLVFTDQTTNSPAVNIAVAGNIVSAGKVYVTDTGFHLRAEVENMAYPNVNFQKVDYQYIAFR